jgi:hypothetical protein
MDALTKLALVGTRNAAEQPATAVSAILPDVERERRLLLEAGALAAYRRAGAVSVRVEPPAPAPEETLQPCPPRVAAHVVGMLQGTHGELLGETARLLAAKGRRLPAEVLPAVLDAASGRNRELVAPILGERGRWLARLSEAWKWVHEADVAPDPKLTFDEGALEARAAALRQIRSSDPAKGRGWLEAVWKAEKANVRARLVAELSVGLGPDDVPFLESARGDRAQLVRAAAAELLIRVPGSPTAGRMRDRVGAMLIWEAAAAPSSAFGRLAAMVTGSGKPKLSASPPQEPDADWEADGLTKEPPQGVGKRAFWLAEAIAAVDPKHWETAFGATPEQILAAERDEWGPNVQEGLARAATRFERADWAVALLASWSDDRKRHAFDPWPFLAKLLSPELAEQAALEAMAAGNAERVAQIVTGRPWSDRFAAVWVAQLRAHLTKPRGQWPDPWLDLLPTAAIALPESALGLAAETFDISADGNAWLAQEWRRRLDDFQETLRVRREIREDLP